MRMGPLLVLLLSLPASYAAADGYQRGKARILTRMRVIDKQLAAADLDDSPSLSGTRNAISNKKARLASSPAPGTLDTIRREKTQALISLLAAEANLDRNAGELQALRALDKGALGWIFRRRAEAWTARARRQVDARRSNLKRTGVLARDFAHEAPIDRALIFDMADDRQAIDDHIASFLLKEFGTRRPLDPADPSTPGFRTGHED
jgi:hypothetical protein